MYDEFFTDGDRPYAENLNDGLLLVDAFNLTVPVELPGMFSNGKFNSSINVPRKCGVGIVSLQSVDSGVTIADNSISGTGTIVFRVYPNFNCFYKWYSLILTKTGTVSVSFRKTDGTNISASIGNNGIISEAAALKELQEIDVVLTLTSANITKILINFINNQGTRTRVSSTLDAAALTNVNGTIASGDTNAVNGDTVNTALSTKEDKSNKVTTLDNSTAHYPSCSAVKAVTDGKADSGHTHDSDDVTGLTANKNVCTNANGKLSTENKNNHNHGNVLSDGKMTTSDASTLFGNFAGINSNNELIKASKLNNTSVYDENSANYTGIGSLSAGASQQTINNAINAFLATIKPVVYELGSESYPETNIVYEKRIVKFTRMGDIVLVEYSVFSDSTIASGGHYNTENDKQIYTIVYIPTECIPVSDKYVDIKTIYSNGTDLRLNVSADGRLRINQSETNAKKINMFGSFIYNRTTETY